MTAKINQLVKSLLPQQKEPTPTSFEKLTVAPTMETEAKMKMVEQVSFDRNINIVIIRKINYQSKS